MLSTLAAFGLAITIFFELAQVFPKVAGGVVGKNSIAANAALKTLLLNRIGATLFFPIVGWKIDHGASAIQIASLMLIGMAAITLITSISIINYYKIIEYTATKFLSIDKSHVNQISISSGYEKKYKFIVIVFIAGLFGHLGMLAPLLVASLLPEYRLTISQLGFLFNSVFSVITIYYIDRKISLLCEDNHPNLVGYGKQILLGRLSAMFSACIILIAFILI